MGLGYLPSARLDNVEGERPPVDELLRELDELHELDRRRNEHVPGSPDHEEATTQLDDRSRRLMDRFRDMVGRAGGHPGPDDPAKDSGAKH